MAPILDAAGAEHDGFGDLLRRYRAAAGLTQEDLAERAGLSVQAIGALERGLRRRPHRDTLDLLAAALALSPEQRATFTAAARRRDQAAPAVAEAHLGVGGDRPAVAA